MANWYLGSTKHAAIAQWAATTAYTTGDIVRQLAAPSVDSERAFRATTTGTSGGSEPAWNLSQGTSTVDNTVTWQEVTGNSTYGWNAAAARQKLFLNSGSSWAAAGDTVYRSNNHAETHSSNITYVSPGTAASPVRILTVNDAAAPPTALATTATVTTTSNSSLIFSTGYAYDYGCTYNAGTSGTVNVAFNSNAPFWWRFEAGAIVFGTTGTHAIVIGVNASSVDDRLVEFINEDVTFSSVNGGFQIFAPFNWFEGSLAGTAVTNLFKTAAPGPGGVVRLSGVDLSLLDSGENLIEIQAGQFIEYNLENCKLGSGVTITTGTIQGQGAASLRMVNCDSADTNYRYHKQDFQGTITSENTIKIANVSRKVVSTADVKDYKPVVSDPIIYFNTNLTSQTVTVEVVNDGLTLTDAEIWLEIEYLGTSGFPLSLFSNDRVSDPVFGTPVNQTTSTAAWITTGLSSPVKQKLEVTFTPLEEGVVKCRVYMARASTTVYFDPKVTVS